MERFTQKKTSQERKYVLGEQEIAQKPYGYTGAAVDRLGVFEDVFEDLIAAQERLAAQLEELRLQGKTKSEKKLEQQILPQWNFCLFCYHS